MKTVTLTAFQQEEIAWKIEIAQTREEEELTPLEIRLDFEDLHNRVAHFKGLSPKRKKVTFSPDEIIWVQSEMSNALDIHGTPQFVGDHDAVGYSNMVHNLFKKLGVEYVDTLQAAENEK